MFGFLIKKTFFDMWDNLISIALLNLGFILVAGITIYFPVIFKSVPVLFFISLFIGFVLFFLYSGAVSGMVSQIADYSRPGFKDFLDYFKEFFPSSMLFGIMNVAMVFLFSIAFPVYSRMKSIIGPIASSLLFWLMVLWILAIQYFFPVQSRLDKSFKKIIKKMFIIVLDNPLFTIGLLISSLFIFFISAFTAFLLPGISAIFLWHNVALKLRLYKYDYLEDHPDDRRNIPWDVLLLDDKEKVGKRTLKGMIFPWKE